MPVQKTKTVSICQVHYLANCSQYCIAVGEKNGKDEQGAKGKKTKTEKGRCEHGQTGKWQRKREKIVICFTRKDYGSCVSRKKVN